MTNDDVAPRQLIPMLHVRDIGESRRFYSALGFKVERTFTAPGGNTPTWVWLSSWGAHLMLVRAGVPVVASQQAVIFYIYVPDIKRAHRYAVGNGLTPGAIAYPSYSPAGEFPLTDPTGYALMFRAPDE